MNKLRLLSKIGFKNAKSFSRLKNYAKEHCDRGCQALVRFYENDKGFIDTLCEDPYFSDAIRKPFVESELYRSLSPTVRDWFVKPIFRKQIFQDPKEINLTVGAAVLGAAALKLKIFEGGMDALPNSLHQRIKDNVSLESPVSNVEKDGERWVIQSDGEDYACDVVVAATPVPNLRRYYPQAPELDYASTNVFVVEGELRPSYDKASTLYILDTGHGIDGMTRYGKHLFKVDSRNSSPRFDEFFRAYDIVAHQQWRTAVPKHPADVSYIPEELEQGLYIAGDQSFPCMEVAIDTGRKAARRIVRSA